jgi:flagellar FliJ protein
MMKSRETILRSRRFRCDEARRRAGQIDAMIEDLTRLKNDLDAQIDTEERRTGLTEPQHFAYSTYARAARHRRENINASLTELTARRARVEAEISDAEADLAAAMVRLDREDVVANRGGEIQRQSA